MPENGTQVAGDSAPLHVAIVGGGPSGFYAALNLLERDDLDVHVDLFDRLPMLFGLVRYGVAPDHAKIKNVTRVFERGMDKAGARFRFLGNVEVGTDVSLDELMAHYDAVILAFGAQSDRRLNIPGEDLHGVYAAREFVAWYNSHPDYEDAEFDLDTERAMVIGVGNVAIDVARILASTDEELSSTDINPNAQAEIAASPINDILVVARRGPAQAACTAVELREMGNLQEATLVVSQRDLDLDPLSRKLLEQGDIDSQNKRNLDAMAEESEREIPDDRPYIHLRFYESPVEFIGEDRLEAVKLRRNSLTQRGDGKVVVEPTDKFEVVPCGVAFRSIGYLVEPVPGVPYYEPWSWIPNVAGQVLKEKDGPPYLGLFVTGWAKRGPSGVIGTNKPCAAETVESLLAARERGELPARTGEDIGDVLRDRGVRFITRSDWEHLDKLERERGEAVGRPRVKFDGIDDMLEAVRD
ncbi:MAG: FAD-dependent oxidoreductase [Anaerolineae bacterium]